MAAASEPNPGVDGARGGWGLVVEAAESRPSPRGLDDETPATRPHEMGRRIARFRETDRTVSGDGSHGFGRRIARDGETTGRRPGTFVSGTRHFRFRNPALSFHGERAALDRSLSPTHTYAVGPPPLDLVLDRKKDNNTRAMRGRAPVRLADPGRRPGSPPREDRSPLMTPAARGRGPPGLGAGGAARTDWCDGTTGADKQAGPWRGQFRSLARAVSVPGAGSFGPSGGHFESLWGAV